MGFHEDFLNNMRQKLYEGIVYYYFRKRGILLDQRDVYAFHYTNTFEGVDYIVTTFGLKKMVNFGVLKLIDC